MERKASDSLCIIVKTLGPVQTNAYILGDNASGGAVVIDPGWNGDVIMQEIDQRGWQLQAVWLTHAHFDHLGGVAAMEKLSQQPLPVALHSEDLPLWRAAGGANLFGFSSFDAGPEPTIKLQHGDELRIGTQNLTVRHTPGHTPGHVIFVHSDAKVVFCGDLIFQSGVGRTDLPGGSWSHLLQSIRTQVLVLSDDTLLYPGHGPATTVGEERRSNPFLTGEF